MNLMYMKNTVRSIFFTYKIKNSIFNIINSMYSNIALCHIETVFIYIAQISDIISYIGNIVCKIVIYIFWQCINSNIGL